MTTLFFPIVSFGDSHVAAVRWQLNLEHLNGSLTCLINGRDIWSSVCPHGLSARLEWVSLHDGDICHKLTQIQKEEK